MFSVCRVGSAQGVHGVCTLHGGAVSSVQSALVLLLLLLPPPPLAAKEGGSSLWPK